MSDVRRIMPYSVCADLDAARAFYVGVLGLEETMDLGSFLGLRSPAHQDAQLVVATPDAQDPQPAFGVDVGTPDAVDAAHAAAQQRGMRIRYGPTDEPWGIRRFFVEDPGGTLVSVLAHVG
jgi:catechol 2,3-dioxygenase-like lactoylglutathione lyase family enzyme